MALGHTGSRSLRRHQHLHASTAHDERTCRLDSFNVLHRADHDAASVILLIDVGHESLGRQRGVSLVGLFVHVFDRHPGRAAARLVGFLVGSGEVDGLGRELFLEFAGTPDFHSGGDAVNSCFDSRHHAPPVSDKM